MTRTCPWCNSSAVAAEYVDIGVGEQRVTPYTCWACGAQEFNPYHDNTRASPEEGKLGWWRGQEGPAVEDPREVQAPAPAEHLLRTCADCSRSADRLRDQERRFQEARAMFEAQAKAITDANAQMKRTITTLQSECREHFDVVNLRREHEEQKRGLEQLLRQHEGVITDLRAQLEKALGKQAPKEEEGVTRFSLLEVD